jgi:hypothetical protein
MTVDSTSKVIKTSHYPKLLVFLIMNQVAHYLLTLYMGT